MKSLLLLCLVNSKKIKIMKVYGTSYGNEIREKAITRKSDKNIFFINHSGNEERQRIDTSYSKWHNSKQEAIDYLIDRTQYAIKSKKEQIQKLEQDLEKLFQLK